MWSLFLLNTTSYFYRKSCSVLVAAYGRICWASKRWTCFFPYWALLPPLYGLQCQHLSTVLLYPCVNRIAVFLAPLIAYYEEKIAAHCFGIYHPWLRNSRKWAPIHFSYWAIFVYSFVIDFCCDGCELSQVLFCTILLSNKKQHQWTIEV